MRRLTENDFLWSVKLGAQLRVLSYEQQFEYIYQTEEEPGKRFRKVINCSKGYCVLCKPDTCGKGVFWVIKIDELESQIISGKLILNNIPMNWSELKLQLNR